MSVEDNKALVRRFYEDVFNQRNLGLVDELCSTTHVFHNPPTTLHGKGSTSGCRSRPPWSACRCWCSCSTWCGRWCSSARLPR